MIGQTQVIIKTPVQHFLTPEYHTGIDFTFELREHEISVPNFLILSQGTSVPANLIKYVHDLNELKIDSKSSFFEYHQNPQQELLL
jgi:hypothetical protein